MHPLGGASGDTTEIPVYSQETFKDKTFSVELPHNRLDFEKGRLMESAYRRAGIMDLLTSCNDTN